MYRQLIAALVTAGALSTNAWAQEEPIVEYVPDGDIAQQAELPEQGWDGTLQISANANVVSNSNVVGQTDGTSLLLGIGVLGGADYLRGRHEWLNTFRLNEAWTRTPVLPEFVKSDDLLSIESLYHYFLISWAGLFAQAEASTALLRTWANTPEPVDYRITTRDGATELREDVQRLRLADPFQPLSLSESAGVFAEPVRTRPFNVSVRVGFGLRETFANGVLVVQDDETTPVIEVVDLTNPDSSLTVFQGGLEGFLGLSGQVHDDRLSYDIGLSALLPFLNNDSEDRSAVELTRIGLVGGIAYGVFDWMSVNYKLRVLQDPQLLDEVQVQNNVLLTFNYTLIEREPEDEPPPEPTEAEVRAAEAEQRAAEAEARAAELQRQLEAQRAAEEAPPEPAAEPAPE